MNPKPANFHNAQRMGTLTPYKVFNTTTFGISGTLMPAFSQLSDAERWSLAFFIFTLRQPACTKPPPNASLAQLATLTDGALAQAFSADDVACLRRSMPVVDAHSSLNLAIVGVREALELSKAGHHAQARERIVDAYLSGVEPVEPLLRARDARMVFELESAFTAARLTAQSGGDLEPDVQVLLTVLQKASAQRASGDFWSVFMTALLILLREGFEAAIVVGALLAVLKKMGATEQSRVVHLGWVSALVVSAVVYYFGQKALAGANREWMETLVSLFAVGMLLYAALWLNARANMSKYMGQLHQKMKLAVGSGNLLGLFLISFTSVGRETLETALFIEGLAGDSPQGAAWGAIAGLGVLTGFLIFVRTVGFVLPMKTLFKASTVLLVATAVMLIGKGFHGLQELGVLPLAPTHFITIEALGIFSDWVSLVPQLILAALPLGWWVAKRPKPRALQSQPSR
jgi:high-affinity iron transporter